jgi:hypothetical protein
MLENYNQHWDKIDQSTFDQFLEEHSAGAWGRCIYLF